MLPMEPTRTMGATAVERDTVYAVRASDVPPPSATENEDHPLLRKNDDPTWEHVLATIQRPEQLLKAETEPGDSGGIEATGGSKGGRLAGRGSGRRRGGDKRDTSIAGELIRFGASSSSSGAPTVGLLLGMCSSDEIIEKQQTSTGNDLERLNNVPPTLRGLRLVNKYLAVKSFQRSDASKVYQPADIRPVLWCRRTVHNMLHLHLAADIESLPWLYQRKIQGEPDYRFLDVYNFMRDRLRSIWTDLTVQHCFTHRGAIESLEISLRFLLLAEWLLCDEPDFNQVQNGRLLSTCLEKLFVCYNAVRQFHASGDMQKLIDRTELSPLANSVPPNRWQELCGILVYPSPYEAEFWTYQALLCLSQGPSRVAAAAMRVKQKIPKEIWEGNYPFLRQAYRIIEAMTENNTVRYFKYKQIPFLMRVLLDKFSFVMRVVLLRILSNVRQSCVIPYGLFLKLFDFEDELQSDVMAFCQSVNATVATDLSSVDLSQVAREVGGMDLNPYRLRCYRFRSQAFLALAEGLERRVILDPDLPVGGAATGKVSALGDSLFALRAAASKPFSLLRLPPTSPIAAKAGTSAARTIHPSLHEGLIGTSRAAGAITSMIGKDGEATYAPLRAGGLFGRGDALQRLAGLVTTGGMKQKLPKPFSLGEAGSGVPVVLRREDEEATVGAGVTSPPAAGEPAAEAAAGAFYVPRFGATDISPPGSAGATSPKSPASVTAAPLHGVQAATPRGAPGLPASEAVGPPLAAAFPSTGASGTEDLGTSRPSKRKVGTLSPPGVSSAEAHPRIKTRRRDTTVSLQAGARPLFASPQPAVSPPVPPGAEVLGDLIGISAISTPMASTAVTSPRGGAFPGVMGISTLPLSPVEAYQAQIAAELQKCSAAYLAEIQSEADALLESLDSILATLPIGEVMSHLAPPSETGGAAAAVAATAVAGGGNNRSGVSSGNPMSSTIGTAITIPRHVSDLSAIKWNFCFVDSSASAITGQTGADYSAIAASSSSTAPCSFAATVDAALLGTLARPIPGVLTTAGRGHPDAPLLSPLSALDHYGAKSVILGALPRWAGMSPATTGDAAKDTGTGSVSVPLPPGVSKASTTQFCHSSTWIRTGRLREHVQVAFHVATASHVAKLCKKSPRPLVFWHLKYPIRLRMSNEQEPHAHKYKLAAGSAQRLATEIDDVEKSNLVAGTQVHFIAVLEVALSERAPVIDLRTLAKRLSKRRGFLDNMAASLSERMADHIRQRLATGVRAGSILESLLTDYDKTEEPLVSALAVSLTKDSGGQGCGLSASASPLSGSAGVSPRSAKQVVSVTSGQKEIALVPRGLCDVFGNLCKRMKRKLVDLHDPAQSPNSSLVAMHPLRIVWPRLKTSALPLLFVSLWKRGLVSPQIRRLPVSPSIETFVAALEIGIKEFNNSSVWEVCVESTPPVKNANEDDDDDGNQMDRSGRGGEKSIAAATRSGKRKNRRSAGADGVANGGAIVLSDIQLIKKLMRRLEKSIAKVIRSPTNTKAMADAAQEEVTSRQLQSREGQGDSGRDVRRTSSSFGSLNDLKEPVAVGASRNSGYDRASFGTGGLTPMSESDLSSLGVMMTTSGEGIRTFHRGRKLIRSIIRCSLEGTPWKHQKGVLLNMYLEVPLPLYLYLSNAEIPAWGTRPVPPQFYDQWVSDVESVPCDGDIEASLLTQRSPSHAVRLAVPGLTRPRSSPLPASAGATPTLTTRSAGAEIVATKKSKVKAASLDREKLFKASPEQENYPAVMAAGGVISRPLSSVEGEGGTEGKAGVRTEGGTVGGGPSTDIFDVLSRKLKQTKQFVLRELEFDKAIVERYTKQVSGGA